MSTSDRLRDATVLRVRRVGEILDAAIVIWTEHFKVLTVLAAALMLPFQVLSALLAVSVKPTLLDAVTQWQKDLTADSTAKPHFTGEQVAAVASSLVVAVVATFVLTAALTAFLTDVYLNRTPDTRAALRTAVRRGPILMASRLLVLLIGVAPYAPGIALLVLRQWVLGALVIIAAVPVQVWLMVKLSVGGPAIVIEKVGPIRALRRSFRLSKARWWPILGVTLLVAVATGLPALLIRGVLAGMLSLAGGNNPDFAFVWSAIAGTISVALTAPVSAAVAVILYIDLRIRHEGFDLEQLAKSPGTALAGPPTLLG
jgi:hypothetical protein